MPGAFWSNQDGVIHLRVRVTPNARSEGCDGLFLDASGRAHLKLRVRAVPERGRANDAVIALVSRLTGTPGSAIAIGTGSSARLKVLRLPGDSATEQALTALAEGTDGKPPPRSG